MAPWDLTDAVDAGRTSEALVALGRLTGPGGSHPLVVLSILHRHYQAMLRLDGAGVTSGEKAAELLGMRSAYPAKKALEQGRKLGPAKLGRAVMLLAEDVYKRQSRGWRRGGRPRRKHRRCHR